MESLGRNVDLPWRSSKVRPSTEPARSANEANFAVRRSQHSPIRINPIRDDKGRDKPNFHQVFRTNPIGEPSNPEQTTRGVNRGIESGGRSAGPTNEAKFSAASVSQLPFRINHIGGLHAEFPSDFAQFPQTKPIRRPGNDQPNTVADCGASNPASPQAQKARLPEGRPKRLTNEANFAAADLCQIMFIIKHIGGFQTELPFNFRSFFANEPKCSRSTPVASQR